MSAMCPVLPHCPTLPSYVMGQANVLFLVPLTPLSYVLCQMYAHIRERYSTGVYIGNTVGRDGTWDRGAV